MNKKFEKVFYDEFYGIDSRFQNLDYKLTAEDKKFLNNYIDYVADIAKKNAAIGIVEFQNVTKVIEVLSKSPDYDTAVFLKSIFLKIEDIE